MFDAKCDSTSKVRLCRRGIAHTKCASKVELATVSSLHSDAQTPCTRVGFPFNQSDGREPVQVQFNFIHFPIAVFSRASVVPSAVVGLGFSMEAAPDEHAGVGDDISALKRYIGEWAAAPDMTRCSVVGWGGSGGSVGG